jgi:preprotein translocase subunit SecA
VLLTAAFRTAPPPPPPLPELPAFLTGQMDAQAGDGHAAGGDGAQRFAPLFGALGEAPVMAPAQGGDPYAGQGLNRNDPCPCGSGNKYKHCHGALV